MSTTSDVKFKEKLIIELHDIALSLREISGRNITSDSLDKKPISYKEKYFARSPKEDK